MKRIPILQGPLFLATAAALVLGGCASVPEPVGELASARTALNSIQDGDAQTLAPVEVDRAKSKLQRAEEAMADERYAEARRLAEESLADTELERAKVTAIEAQRSADELEKSIQVMRYEIYRAKTGL